MPISGEVLACPKNINRLITEPTQVGPQSHRVRNCPTDRPDKLSPVQWRHACKYDNHVSIIGQCYSSPFGVSEVYRRYWTSGETMAKTQLNPSSSLISNDGHSSTIGQGMADQNLTPYAYGPASFTAVWKWRRSRADARQSHQSGTSMPMPLRPATKICRTRSHRGAKPERATVPRLRCPRQPQMPWAHGLFRM